MRPTRPPCAVDTQSLNLDWMRRRPHGVADNLVGTGVDREGFHLNRSREAGDEGRNDLGVQAEHLRRIGSAVIHGASASLRDRCRGRRGVKVNREGTKQTTRNVGTATVRRLRSCRSKYGSPKRA